MDILQANLSLLFASLVAAGYAASFIFRYGTFTARETIITANGKLVDTDWWSLANSTFGYGGLVIYTTAFVF